MNSKGRNPAADYTIGIYIRLSLADEDTGYGSKSESDSISATSVCSSTGIWMNRPRSLSVRA